MSEEIIICPNCWNELIEDFEGDWYCEECNKFIEITKSVREGK